MPGFAFMGVNGNLFHIYLGGFVALTADIKAGRGILHAHTLEVVEFNGSVGFSLDIVDTALAVVVMKHDLLVCGVIRRSQTEERRRDDNVVVDTVFKSYGH